MDTVTSRDGTRIAYDKQGSGPALVLVAGAMCARLAWSGPGLSKLLSSAFTVFNYDRRGRGDSANTPPYAVEKEIDDIDALIDAAGGTAFLYGHSSGAALAMETSVKLGGKVRKLAMYEAPFNDDPTAQAAWERYRAELGQLLAAGKRGDAVALFMRYVGTPDAHIEGMRHAPSWPMMEALGPTLAYDASILGKGNAIPTQRAAQAKTPTLIMSGTAGAPFMVETSRTLARLVPHAELRLIDGQNHDVKSDVLAPILAEFFGK